MDKHFCIFDMDGTLTDSMGYWKELGVELLQKHHIQPTEGLIDRIRVFSMKETAACFVEELGFPGTPEEVAEQFNGAMAAHYRRDVPLKPGVEDYLRRLRADGVRLAVASATDRPLIEVCLERLGVAELFDVILSCEDVGQGKESPAVYLEAARRLGAEPRDCAVFEDALSAARTARQAGFYTVGVYDVYSAEDWPRLRALCHETFEDWRDLL